MYKYTMDWFMHFFYVSLMVDLLLNGCAVWLGVKAYNTHQIKAYKNFSLIYVICILSRILLAYLNT